MYDYDHPMRCFHVSFITKGNKILSIGVNSPKSHVKNLRNPKPARDGYLVTDEKGTCSELNAITKFLRKTEKKSEKCCLTNVRIDRNMELSLSQPCESCLSLLKYHKFKSVYFTDGEGEVKKYGYGT